MELKKQKEEWLTQAWADILLLPVAFDVSGTSSAHSMCLLRHEAIRALAWKPWPGPDQGSSWESKIGRTVAKQKFWAGAWPGGRRACGLNLKSGSDWKCWGSDWAGPSARRLMWCPCWGFCAGLCAISAFMGSCFRNCFWSLKCHLNVCAGVER